MLRLTEPVIWRRAGEMRWVLNLKARCLAGRVKCNSSAQKNNWTECWQISGLATTCRCLDTRAGKYKCIPAGTHWADVYEVDRV